MALRRIPLEAYPFFTEQVDLDGTTYSLRFRWSQRDTCWHMDMRTLDDAPVLLSARLVTGFPLLRRVIRTVRPPGELVMLDLSGQWAEPNLEEFGTRFALFYAEAET